MRARPLLLLVLWLANPAFPAENAAPPPPPDQIIEQMLERAAVLYTNSTSRHAYYQTTVVEYLDSNGQVKERKEKFYEVTMIGTALRSRLLKIDGKPLPEKQLRDAEEDDRRRRSRLEGRDREQKDPYINRDLASRYTFKFEHTETLNGRPTWVISFRPRSDDLPVKKKQDRFLNKARGVVWIDVADREIAKADVSLSERITLWGGIIGTLDIFDLTITRTRDAEGVWYNQRTNLSVSGRKLFSPIRFRAREETSGFRKLPATPETPSH
ncbi:MAG: hypothetical protein AB1705_12100 [Verrucomicrobiota bacterium]